MMLLSEQELVELTGYKTGKGQVHWLRERGWRFELNRIGKPRVDREYYRARMGCQEAANAPSAEEMPNWAAI